MVKKTQNRCLMFLILNQNTEHWWSGRVFIIHRLVDSHHFKPLHALVVLKYNVICTSCFYIFSSPFLDEILNHLLHDSDLKKWNCQNFIFKDKDLPVRDASYPSPTMLVHPDLLCLSHTVFSVSRLYFCIHHIFAA